MQSYPLARYAQLQRFQGRRGPPNGVVPVGIVVEVGIAYLSINIIRYKPQYSSSVKFRVLYTYLRATLFVILSSQKRHAMGDPPS